MLRFRALLPLLGLLAASPAHAGVTVGTPFGYNCYPFACAATDAVYEYQEQYSASAFSGSITFNQISFFLAVPGPLDSSTYTVSFSTSAASFGNMSASLSDNIGGDNEVFGTFVLSGSVPAVLTLTGNAFTYDPTSGAPLLMDVQISNNTYQTGYCGPLTYCAGFFQADYSGSPAVLRSWISDDYGTTTNANGALVTEFTSVPEPASFALIGLGLTFCGLGAGKRLRRA